LLILRQNMRIVLHRHFDKDVQKYASSDLTEDIFDFIDALEKVQNLSEISDIKKLSGFINIYRYRIRDYRIGFRLREDGIIQIDRFLHRKDIYKKYP
jgi:mRNA interferase RelE/StbE